MTHRFSPVRTAVSALALALAVPTAATLVLPASFEAAQAQDVSVGAAFHDQLAPYGDWVTVKNYGRVWRPHGMEADWWPYTQGHWEYTDDYGWYWQSKEEWGWIPFHYGRWALTDDTGWVWIPGSVWAPAWVAWRTGAGSGSPQDIGWAPLPPQDVAMDAYQREPRYWTFVRSAEILAPDIATVAVRVRDEPAILQRTTIVDRTVLVDQGGFNRGVPIERLRTAVGHPIATVRVQPRLFNVEEQVRAHHLNPDLVRVFDSERTREVTVIRDEGFAHRDRHEVLTRTTPINIDQWRQARERHSDAWRTDRREGSAGGANGAADRNADHHGADDRNAKGADHTSPGGTESHNERAGGGAAGENGTNAGARHGASDTDSHRRPGANEAGTNDRHGENAGHDAARGADHGGTANRPAHDADHGTTADHPASSDRHDHGDAARSADHAHGASTPVPAARPGAAERHGAAADDHTTGHGAAADDHPARTERSGGPAGQHEPAGGGMTGRPGPTPSPAPGAHSAAPDRHGAAAEHAAPEHGPAAAPAASEHGRDRGAGAAGPAARPGRGAEPAGGHGAADDGPQHRATDRDHQ